MPLPIYHLRRLLATTAILVTVLVGGMYIYARMRTRDVRKDVPGKLPFEISQTANGFRISKSDGKRTLFTVEARDVKEFKLNGHAELHDVNIILYGRDSTRFDQIAGNDFSYDEKTGDIVAKGEVQIDLLANPSGTASPDQTAPKIVKNPIHLKTRDLVFNKDSGDASTDARVDFRTPQATGWALGAKYAGKTNVLTLASQVHVTVDGPKPAILVAQHGVITSDPHDVVLDHPHLDHENQTMQSDQAVFHLGPDNSVQSIFATGNVMADMRNAPKSGQQKGSQLQRRPEKNQQVTDRQEKDQQEKDQQEKDRAAQVIHARSDQGEFQLTETRNLLRTATLTGNVHIEQAGPQPVQGDSQRAILEFAGQNQLQKVHALDGARLVQRSANSKQSGTNSGPQDFELTAPIIDFDVADGNILTHAETTGPARITISPSQQSEAATAKASQQTTVVTAGKFTAKFEMADGKDHITTMHGAPDARIVSSNPGVPDRISTSDFVDAMFLPQGGIDSITQTGHLAYTDQLTPEKRTQAWANSGRYTPADQMLLLTGAPRVVSGSMLTTAKIIRMNRETGDAFAEGDVKSTYSELKEQPNGALLSSSSPIHVTSRTMTAHNMPGVALYVGNARLWQDANIIEAPSIQFDRERRFVSAQGTPTAPVLTTLVQAKVVPEKPGAAAEPKKPENSNQTSPIAITGQRLTYADAERKTHYEGDVSAKGTDFTANAKSADAYLVARSQAAGNQSVAQPSRLDHLIAYDDVVVQQTGRRADGEKLVYTSSDDKFVLTGGPPSIFDAEQGKITGVSLTFFRGDDRVLVEGEAKTPVVTKTQVTR
jgi:lipopolysaccharide export system protein LptA